LAAAAADKFTDVIENIPADLSFNLVCRGWLCESPGSSGLVLPAIPIEEGRRVHPGSIGRLVADVGHDAGHNHVERRSALSRRSKSFHGSRLADLVRPLRPENHKLVWIERKRDFARFFLLCICFCICICFCLFVLAAVTLPLRFVCGRYSVHREICALAFVLSTVSVSYLPFAPITYLERIVGAASDQTNVLHPLVSL
jgi:hypothetical protein